MVHTMGRGSEQATRASSMAGVAGPLAPGKLAKHPDKPTAIAAGPTYLSNVSRMYFSLFRHDHAQGSPDSITQLRPLRTGVKRRDRP